LYPDAQLKNPIGENVNDSIGQILFQVFCEFIERDDAKLYTDDRVQGDFDHHLARGLIFEFDVFVTPVAALFDAFFQRADAKADFKVDLFAEVNLDVSLNLEDGVGAES